MSNFTDDAVKILQKRYLLKDAAGQLLETPDQMLHRVAAHVAGPEQDRNRWEEEFFGLLASNRFLPNSPTLANAGRANGQLAACFVLPIDDSIEGIFETMKRSALVHKTGGGTGFSFSGIRPKDDVVSSTGGVASGPLSFITAFNCATEAIRQGGMRRGANMAVMDYWHPDIFDFIQAKKEEGALVNFNLSVGIDRLFMKEVTRNGYVNMVNPRTGRPAGGPVKAAELLDAMVTAAWENGEPGILFFDRINEANTVPGYGSLQATNPCGEQPLFAHESCNLGSLRLPSYLYSRSGDYRTRINWDLLEQDITAAVRFLDNVIDTNYYIFPEIEDITKGNRKIGLGVMGFADMMVELGVPYASEGSLEIIDALMGFINRKAREASILLAREKGSFPNLRLSVYRGQVMRNATVTTIAPTGTLSMLADTSSGIEPLFGLSYIKEALDGKQFPVTNAKFAQVAVERGFWSRDLVDEVAHRGSLSGIPSAVPDDVRAVFATAHEIMPEWHVRVQAAFQKHVDNAVSKTINFPFDADPENIKSAYLTAWNLGCKGLTIYRTGSRQNQVLRFISKDRGDEENPNRCQVCTE